MLRLFTFLALAGFCLATTIRYPTSGNKTCILMDISVDNTITWTNSSGKSVSQNWNFTDSTTITGRCSEDNPRVTRHWNSDGGTFTFSFMQKEGQASVEMSLNLVPDNAFTNGDKVAMEIDLKPMALGAVDKAFTCQTVPDMKASTKSKTGNNTYSMTMRIKYIQVQAFNLTGGKFGEDEVCEADQTTTAKPDTTEPQTTKPTTEPPTTEPSNHTTPGPSNHTTPAPPPKPSSGHPTKTINFYDKSMNVTCVNIKGQFLFTLPYMKKDKTNGTATVGLDDIVSTIGSCNDTNLMNTVMINFYNGWWMNLTFKREDSNSNGASAETKYWWHELDLTYTLDDATFPDRDPNVSSMNLNKVFKDNDINEATVEGSYLCNSNIKTDLGDGAELQTWDLQYNAFQSGNKTTFGDDNVAECKDDAKTNSIVPIAVGAALAGLVVIVLIAYLIGRRRNRKGYESV